MNPIPRKARLRTLKRKLTSLRREINRLDDQRQILFGEWSGTLAEISALENAAPASPVEPGSTLAMGPASLDAPTAADAS